MMHGMKDVQHTKIIQLHIFCQVDPESSGRNAKAMLVDECFWAIMSLTAGRQKCSIRTCFKVTLSLFCFSLYGPAKYQLKNGILIWWCPSHGKPKLDIAFNYVVSIDSTLFIVASHQYHIFLGLHCFADSLHTAHWKFSVILQTQSAWCKFLILCAQFMEGPTSLSLSI